MTESPNFKPLILSSNLSINELCMDRTISCIPADDVQCQPCTSVTCLHGSCAQLNTPALRQALHYLPVHPEHITISSNTKSTSCTEGWVEEREWLSESKKLNSVCKIEISEHCKFLKKKKISPQKSSSKGHNN